MRKIISFYTQLEAMNFISSQSKPRLGDYFVDRNIITGMFDVYLTD